MDARKVVPAVLSIAGAILKVIFDIKIDREKMDDKLERYDKYLIDATTARLDKVEQVLLGNTEKQDEVEETETEEEAPE